MTDTALPLGPKLRTLMNVESTEGVCEIISASLIAPLDDLMGRPSKRIRGELVEIGFRLGEVGLSQDRTSQNSSSLPQRELCQKLSLIIEGLHAGSLIIDDIADGSQFRRGELTLHEKYGLPIALNSANWLYFWSIERVRELGLESTLELEIYRRFHRALVRAHIGQAVDVGVPIENVEREKVRNLCVSSIEMKTGALFALGVSIGGMAGGASLERTEILSEFGHRFGMALQMFNDIGVVHHGKADPKRYEDFILHRPSWVWAVASAELGDSDYQIFRDAVRSLPDQEALDQALRDFRIVEVATEGARRQLDQSLEFLGRSLKSGPELEPLLEQTRDLAERFIEAHCSLFEKKNLL